MKWRRPSVRPVEPPEPPEKDETLVDWVAACLVHQIPTFDLQALSDRLRGAA